MNRFSEKDWKVFRSKIAGWQEAYMDKLNIEYIEILSGEGNPYCGGGGNPVLCHGGMEWY